MGTRSIRLLLPAVAVAVLAVFVLAGCGDSSNGGGAGASPPSSPTAGGTTVAIEDFAYSPPTLTVEPGTTVTWTNNDGTPHTVTSADGISTDAETTDLFDSGSMAKGDTFSYTFTEPGTYFYVCTLHRSVPSMHAKVVVSG